MVCDPEDPNFGKSMDLRGLLNASGNYGLADSSYGNFSVIKRRLLNTVPSLLSESINCLQKLMGSDDVSRKQMHTTDEPLKGASRASGCCSYRGIKPPRFSKLPFESCWDLVLSVDPTRMAIWRTSPLSSWSLFRIHLLGALVSAMLCLRARATTLRICRA